MPLHPSHSGILVITAILIAILASYTSLVLVSRAHQAPADRDKWLLFAAMTFGTGIWSMHFTAMLAMHFELPFSFEPLNTLASWIMACFFTSVGLSLKEWLHSPWRLVLAAMLMGLGIAGMHYTGMAAMQIQAQIQYTPWSVLGACLVGFVASWMALRGTEINPHRMGGGIRPLAALCGGLAVSGLHYVAMAGTHFRFNHQLPPSDGLALSLPLLATLLVLANLALLASAWALNALAEKTQQQHRLYHSLSEVELHRRMLRRQVEGLEIWFSADGSLEQVNGDIQTILGEPELDHHDPWYFLDNPSQKVLKQIWHQLRQQQQLTLCLHMVKKSGQILRLGLDASLSPATQSGLLMLRQIREREPQSRDNETGLSSRQFLEDQGDSSTAMTLLCIQVPLFSSLVHLVSQTLYQQALALWINRLRHTFTPLKPLYLARLDTDIFLVALDDPRRQYRANEALLLRSQLSSPLNVDRESWYLHLAMGVTWMDAGCSGKLLVQSALAALKGAQQQPDKMLLLDSRDTPLLISRLQLEQELHLAQVANDFPLRLQPKARLDNGQITSLEVLIRWQHKDKGLVPPSDFIPMLEHSGLIHHVGDWVLDQALTLLAQWRQHPRLGQLDLAVNISAVQLQSDSFVADLEKSRHRHGVEAHKLILEITETVAMEQPQVAQHQMGKLRRLGYQLSIDDFGTGYASLAYLRDFPLHELKIDKAFVQQLDTEEGRQLVKIMGLIGQTLGYRTVAEGVESHEQMTLLRTLNIDLAQGYIIAKPMTLDSFTRWFLHDDRNSG